MVYRLRAVDADGDMTFGQSGRNFLIDSPAAVAQRINSRLGLWEGEWYLDKSAGTAYYQDMLGHNNYGLASAMLRERIFGTPFVTNITDWSTTFTGASVDPTESRSFAVSGKVDTAFGFVQTDVPVNPNPPTEFTLGSSPLGGQDWLGGSGNLS